ncbi:hypothetical protein FMM68_09810 [Lachnospiraceae bacterium MD329]|nr:hypothetical protein [Lachnospiraceae bacterium MD329]
MNREILFRGKRKSSRKKYQIWVYGSLFLEKGYCSIQFYTEGMMSIDDADVIPETVGQYTGLTDKNGKKIFEGDIAKYNTLAANERTVYGIIKYRSTYEQYRSHNPCGYIIDWQKNNSTGRTLREDLPFWCDSMSNMEVIGNIHDNPELMEETE